MKLWPEVFLSLGLGVYSKDKDLVSSPLTMGSDGETTSTTESSEYDASNILQGMHLLLACSRITSFLPNSVNNGDGRL